MAKVWFTSDLHLGHKNIATFRKEVTSQEHNTALISEDWFTYVGKRDIVWVLGDIAFTDDGLANFFALPGTKRIVLGNHDPFPANRYTARCDMVRGAHRYKNTWLTHIPIHPAELRGKHNLHGHVHYATLDDDRYFNCCVENCLKVVGRTLISLDELRQLNVIN